MSKKETRKDSRGIVLKAGEYQRPNGKYEYKYVDIAKKRHSVSADTLKELRVRAKQLVKDDVAVGDDYIRYNPFDDAEDVLKGSYRMVAAFFLCNRKFLLRRNLELK